MDSIKRKNRVLTAIWCTVLTVAGVAIGFTVNADTYLATYYDTFWYMVVELSVTALIVLWVALWWHFATSESIRVQGLRMWISLHGTLAPLLSCIPVWLAASIAHVICSTSFSVGNSGYRIYSVYVLPLLYMALTYMLPPVEIRETIVPGGPVAQKIARGVIVAALIASIVGILLYDFS